MQAIHGVSISGGVSVRRVITGGREVFLGGCFYSHEQMTSAYAHI